MVSKEASQAHAHETLNRWQKKCAFQVSSITIGVFWNVFLRNDGCVQMFWKLLFSIWCRPCSMS